MQSPPAPPAPPGVSPAAGQRSLARVWERARTSGSQTRTRPGLRGSSAFPLPSLPEQAGPVSVSHPPANPFGRESHGRKWKQASVPAQHLSHAATSVSGIQRSRSRFPRRTEGLAPGCASTATAGLPAPCGVSKLGIPSPQNPSKGLCCPWQERLGRGGKTQTCAEVVGRAEAGQEWQGSPGRAGLQGLPPPVPSLPPAVAIVPFSHREPV